jgi:regulator of RNase E activity RraB
MNDSEPKKQIEGHNRSNHELVVTLKNKGLSEDDWIEAEYHFWAQEQDDAVAFAKQLYDEGFLILVIAPVVDDDGTTWDLEVQMSEPIKKVVSEQKTKYLVRLADKFNSVYDGWGTSL